jgi:hypothetical protein
MTIKVLNVILKNKLTKVISKYLYALFLNNDKILTTIIKVDICYFYSYKTMGMYEYN